MKKFLLGFVALLVSISNAWSIDHNTVEIVYSGSSATITLGDSIKNYITVLSGTSSHVRLVQSDTFAGVNKSVDNEDGEITYSLAGTSTDGEFYLEGSYKCTVELNGLMLTNPSGAALALMNGKRVAVSAKKSTTNTLTDATNETYNGCLHCKGHLKLKGKGTLNIVGNSKHAVYSKEYMEIKNLTLNITSSVKDALHCKEYFLMESGTVTISSATEDGIQVELSGLTSTGATTNHEEEDSGNFYMADGTLNISNYGGKAIKADGTITYTKGTQNFNTEDTLILASIETLQFNTINTADALYDLNGRQLPMNAQLTKGIYLKKQNGQTTKILVK
jgi:hypothetical protein